MQHFFIWIVLHIGSKNKNIKGSVKVMKKLMIGLLTVVTVTGMTVPTFAGDI